MLESTHPVYLPTNLWSAKTSSNTTANTFHNLDIKGLSLLCLACTAATLMGQILASCCGM